MNSGIKKHNFEGSFNYKKTLQKIHFTFHNGSNKTFSSYNVKIQFIKKKQ